MGYNAYHEGAKVFKTSICDIKQQIMQMKQENYHLRSAMDRCKSEIQNIRDENTKLSSSSKNSTMDFDNLQVINDEITVCLKQVGCHLLS